MPEKHSSAYWPCFQEKPGAWILRTHHNDWYLHCKRADAQMQTGKSLLWLNNLDWNEQKQKKNLHCCHRQADILHQQYVIFLCWRVSVTINREQKINRCCHSYFYFDHFHYCHNIYHHYIFIIIIVISVSFALEEIIKVSSHFVLFLHRTSGLTNVVYSIQRPTSKGRKSDVVPFPVGQPEHDSIASKVETTANTVHHIAGENDDATAVRYFCSNKTHC